MTRYRKKPVEVEAWQVSTYPIPDWVSPIIAESAISCGMWDGEPVDWVVTDGNNVLTMTDEVFGQTYEVME